ncbi:hypothetical protein [Rhizobium bangladeshense]|uniref:hypothetical protein n=1 Tax=Rhizobium bangladeshense TaxID=1138189 RepID=UPI001C83D65D|nr:hypothetical protein [Rhizobium bangladeshense]MBX4916712.1 hypothetical protein [Rhizobium bangladeshense]
MKDQYVGDINDYRKYVLLRLLSADSENHIGVCWMLTPSDGRMDGGKLAYLQQPERHRHIDPVLFDILVHAASSPDHRRLATIENNGAIPGALYQNDLLPDDPTGRHAFMARCASAFSNVDLIFFDPDNGLEVALPKGRRNSSKYLYLDEVATFFDTGKSLLIYQHFPRIERSAFINSCVERLRSAAPRAAIWTYTTAHVVFLLLIHPESPARLAFAAMLACERWGAEFITGRFLGFEPPTL